MQVLQQHLDEIKLLGATLIAISPELSKNAQKTAQKNKVDYPILIDKGNKVAKKFGLAYTLPKSVTDLFHKFGLDLSKYNQTKSDELPLTPTYVIDQSGVIRYSFVTADYTKRAEPYVILDQLGKISSGPKVPGETSSPFSSPKKAVETFIEACIKKDGDLLSRSFSSRAAGEFKAVREKKLQPRHYKQLVDMFAGAKVIGVDTKGDTAKVDVKLGPKSRRSHETLTLVKEKNGEWKILDF